MRPSRVKLTRLYQSVFIFLVKVYSFRKVSFVKFNRFHYKRISNNCTYFIDITSGARTYSAREKYCRYSNIVL